MKKLIVATAAIALAVASQAAVVDWGYTITGDKTVSSETEGKASDYAKNYVAYLFAADALEDWSKLKQSDLSSATDSSAVKYQTYTKRGGATYATADGNGTVGAARSLDVGSAASFTGKIVVVDTVNNTYNASDIIIASRDETSGAGTEGIKSVAQATFAGLTFGQFYGGDTPTPPDPPGPGPIPEPTSGLLLLVGGAMLALRRKQK